MAKTEREQFYDDVITTALEGGIGYWSMCTEYDWSDDGPTTAEIFQTEGDPIVCVHCGQELRDGRQPWEAYMRAPVFFLTEQEIEQIDAGLVKKIDHEHEPVTMPVTRDTVAKAFDVMMAGPVKYMSDSYRARLIGAWIINDAGEIDAGDADAIVQVGLFGEVVYG